MIAAALDAAAIDAHRFYTSDNHRWLKQAFIDVYTIMRDDALARETRILCNNRDAKVSVGMDALAVQLLSLPTRTGESEQAEYDQAVYAETADQV